MAATALIFPGQGSQRVGMAQDLCERSAAARSIFALAEQVADRPIGRLCFEGPEDQLRATDVAQPALVAHGLAALAALAERLALAMDELARVVARLGVGWVAGHSLGEYAACVAAGALTPEDGLRLAAERGRLMRQAPPGAMAAVLGLDADRLAALCRAIDGVVVVANDNAPGQTVLSGEAAAVARAGEAASAAGARRVIPLNVAGAFHSPLMAEASEAFGAVVGRVAIGRPAITIIGNVDAAPLVDPEAIRAELSRQIAAPVRWRESIEWLAAAGMARAIECGPGNVLTGLLRRTTVTVEARTLGTYAEVETLADELRAGPG